MVHQAAVLHRDIKPSNILIRRSDDRPVLIDFGAAKDDFVRYTKSSAPHTQGYAAIEQMEADGKLGPWTDLYGLGAVLWRIVAGGHPSFERLVPVDALSRMAARFRRQQDPLPSARKLGAGRFSIAVLEAIDKCLELAPTDRPADCGELLRLMSVPVGKVETGHANARKDESGRGGGVSGQTAEPSLEFTVKRADSEQGWKSPLLGVGTLLVICAIALIVDGIGLRQARVRDSSEDGAHEGGLQVSAVGARDENLTPSRLTAEKDPPTAARNLLPLGNEDRRRPGRSLLVPNFGILGGEAVNAEPSVESNLALGSEIVPQGGSEPSSSVWDTGFDPLGSVYIDPQRGPERSNVEEVGDVSAVPQARTSDARDSTNSDPPPPVPALARVPAVPPASSNTSRNIASRLQHKDSDGVESEYFTRGSHRDDVLRLQGTPDSVNRYEALGHEVWSYGGSTVTISTRDGRVRQWSNRRGNLRARLEAGSNSTGAEYFTRGSHRDDVLRLQGTPDSINRYEALGHEVWSYGGSTVTISTRDGRVGQWSNRRGNLRARLEAGSNSTGAEYFTRGSHRDDVLRLQGTPDSINRYEALGHEVWSYGGSTVTISTRDGRVGQWSNRRGNLRARLEAGSNSTGAEYFTRGSHRDDVLRLQGTPDSINRYEALGHEVWSYGGSTVTISTRDGRVGQWSNRRGNLKVR